MADLGVSSGNGRNGLAPLQRTEEEMRRFLRKASVEREPLAVTMTGVRMGERVLQIGLGDARLSSRLAAKPGLSGHAAFVVPDPQMAERAQAVAAEAGLLVDVHVAPVQALPLTDQSFDVVIVHDAATLLTPLAATSRTQAMAEIVRVLRSGGRLVALEPGTPSGLRGLLVRAPAIDPEYVAGGGTAAALQAAGLRGVRLLADRDGYRFFEGLKA